MKLGLELKGFDELERKLAKLADDKTSNQIVRHAYRAGAKLILKAILANVPVDKGDLKKGQKIKAGRRRRGRITVLVGETDYRGAGFYGAMVEYGHLAGSRKLGDARKPVPAHPFMRPAVDATKSEVEATVAADIEAGIEKALK